MPPAVSRRGCWRGLLRCLPGAGLRRQPHRRICANVLKCCGHDILNELRVGAWNISFRKPIFPTHNVRSLRCGGSLVKGYQAISTLTAEPTIGSDKEVLNIYVF